MGSKKSSSVLKILNENPARIFKPKELARLLGVKKPSYPQFRDMIKKMATQGQIAKHRGNHFGAIKRAATVEGELQVKSSGYGFLISAETKEDIFVSQKNMGVALDRDLVRVQLYANSKGISREGRVVEIIRRGRANIVGTFQKNRKFGFVVPDDRKISRDILITTRGNLRVRPGQKVVVTITGWEDERLNPEGEIVEILGFPDESGVSIESVIRAMDVPTKFPKRAMEEAKAQTATIALEEIKRRLDLRGEICFTIDPEDAKDYDDAVSVKPLPNGHHELGVHIADVSHYVQERSALDKVALQRGTSIYLPGRVIPMLPEELSNVTCSLQPQADRLAMSCIMVVTESGNVVSYEIAESIIRSKRRFTYAEANAIIHGNDGADDFGEELRTMYKLSRILIKRRDKLGSLDFELPEVKVVLDENGMPTGLKRVERLDSHRLVEEFMLLANQTATKHVALAAKRNNERVRPFIYRIHESPDENKIDDFRNFAFALGHPLEPHKRITAKFLQRYLRRLKDKPEAGVLQKLLLRSMMKARYSTKNVGHFGLAFKDYTHFTSPIRRYPDLAVHRLLKAYKSPFDFNTRKAKQSKLSGIAKRCSEREIVALEAERESIKLKKVEFMQRHLGDEFNGKISGVVRFGIFVEIDDLLVDGLVHISDLDDDYYLHDEKKYELLGEVSGKRYRLGDAVKVQVVRVDAHERTIDFVLV